jgi:Ca2+-binding RTX toxin-like protein
MPGAAGSPSEARAGRRGAPRGRALAAIAAIVVALVVVLGLIFTASPDALRMLCGGRQATIASNDRLIRGTRAPDVIVGGRGANTIRGAGGNDVICGGYGRDRIHGGRGKDTIDGKKGADVVRGGRGSDEVDGGAARDRVFGDSGNDAVRGGPGGRDHADGGLGDDRVWGGRGGFDTVFGGTGRDRIDGGPGEHDVATYRSAGGPISIDLERGTVTGAEQERMFGIEDVVGGPGDDLLTTSETTANRLDGGPGDDRLIGSLQSDEAFGGPGSDECFGPFAVVDSCGASGAGAGTQVELYRSFNGPASIAIAGNGGVDDLSVSRRGRRYVIGGGTGNPVQLGDSRYASGCRPLPAGVSCAGPVASILVSLGAGNDRLAIERSVRAQVTADGGPGSDWLRGGRGRDTIYSGDDADPDRLDGRGGDDALFGVNILHPRRGSGAATMLGGGGDDLLIGGQPCEGDLFRGGRGGTDSASFARVRNDGIVVKAKIGGSVVDPEVPGCAGGRIAASTEKIEGSTGPDVLVGGPGANTLLGRGGPDALDGRGGDDRCIGGRGRDRDRRCEYVR